MKVALLKFVFTVKVLRNVSLNSPGTGRFIPKKVNNDIK
jgi:hypothetical protein